jgi:hypothetical protein
LSDTTIAGVATSASQIMIAPREPSANSSRSGGFTDIAARLTKLSPSLERTAARRRVVWGDSRTVIWGDSDTVIWGDSDTVIWGDSNTVIWGDSNTVIWGDSNTVIWGD